MPSYTVADMTCGHCAKTIEKAIASLDAHATVRIDLTRKRVEVAATRATDAQLRAAMVEAGYTPEVEVGSSG